MSATLWHALDPAECLRLQATTASGLDEREALSRRARFGPNAFRARAPASPWRILAAQFRGVLVMLLVAAAAIALLSGDPVDAAAIGAVLALNVALGFVTELRANRAMEALLSLEVTRAVVLRDGQPYPVNATVLVPGDVIVLEPGQAVPADARLLEAAELAVEEASLTGESLPADKRAHLTLPGQTALADRANMLYKTTLVVRGTARALVVATGMDTEVGRIGALAAGIAETRTPLETRLESLGRRLAAVAIGIGAVIAALGFLQNRHWSDVAQMALALAVAAVPEGLPVVATIAMAIGVHRMARRQALIRRLPAVETLGSTTLICADKTGTLTAGRMSVEGWWMAGREVAPAQAAVPLRIGALVNRTASDPTEAALLAAARAGGIDPAALARDWPLSGEIPFASSRMWMATVHRHGAALVAQVKGAPERVLSLCRRWSAPSGEAPLDDEARRVILSGNEILARRGLRVLALAEGRVGGTDPAAITGLTFVGLVGLMDPVAPRVPETIQRFRAAGIRTIMLTGDQRATADAVASELGLLADNRDVLDGAELDLLDDDAVATRVATAGALSRVSPEGKLRVVAAFQRRGEVVAMLGDGVNDAAALRQADVGVAMGRRGTDLAKEAADVILRDDSFETIGAAIEEGRVVFANIRRFVFYLFSCNLAELLVFLGAGLAGMPAPLTALQILWLNLVTDTFPALALAGEPAEPDVMERPPRPRTEGVLPPPLVRETLVFGVLIALAALGALAWSVPRGGAAYAATMAFHTLALAQLLHLGNARGTAPVTSRARALANRWALAAVGLVLALQLAASLWPALAGLLDLAPLGLADWAAVAGFGAAPAIIGQIVKSRRAAGLTSAHRVPGGDFPDRDRLARSHRPPAVS